MPARTRTSRRFQSVASRFALTPSSNTSARTRGKTPNLERSPTNTKNSKTSPNSSTTCLPHLRGWLRNGMRRKLRRDQQEEVPDSFRRLCSLLLSAAMRNHAQPGFGEAKAPFPFQRCSATATKTRRRFALAKRIGTGCRPYGSIRRAKSSRRPGSISFAAGETSDCRAVSS